MKRIFLITGILFSALQQATPQMFLDSVWFDVHWKQCQQEDALYYRLVYADTTGKIQFLVKDYYKSGVLQMEGAFKSINPDIRDGHFSFYYNNGTKSSEIDYRTGEVVGTVKEWYANGNQKSEAEYENQLLNGIYKTWREDGSPSVEVNYKNGELDGPFISFYNNGNKVRQDTYANGIIKKKHCYTLTGKDTTWFPYIEMPEFPGGIQKFREFVNHNLIYPAEAKKRKLQGRVDVEISISSDGKVLKANVVHSDREVFNQEAVRLVMDSPEWKPGKKDGERVEITITVPIWFSLRSDKNESK